jgi:hypothetical protein
LINFTSFIDDGCGMTKDETTSTPDVAAKVMMSIENKIIMILLLLLLSTLKKDDMVLILFRQRNLYYRNFIFPFSDYSNNAILP